MTIFNFLALVKTNKELIFALHCYGNEPFGFSKARGIP
jgi:hypothetical protein